MSRPRLAIDMDDVLKDTFTALCGHYNETYGTTFIPDDHIHFDLTKVWKLDEQEKNRRLMNFFHSDHHQAASPMEGACEALITLAVSFELHVVTARFQEVEAQSIAWLERHFPGLIARVHLTGTLVDGKYVSAKEKSAVCREIGAIAFIDDSTKNVKQILAELAIPAYLFSAPHNRDAEVPVGAIRVNNWSELLPLLMRHT